MQETFEAPVGFGRLVGYRLVAWRAGYAEVALTLEAQHLNRTGVPHGGVLTTLIDTACGYAGVHAEPPAKPRRAVTLALSAQFVGRAGAGSSLRAIARQTGGGRRIFFTICEVLDEAGNLIAQGEATFRYRGGGEDPEGERD